MKRAGGRPKRQKCGLTSSRTLIVGVGHKGAKRMGTNTIPWCFEVIFKVVFYFENVFYFIRKSVRISTPGDDESEDEPAPRISCQPAPPITYPAVPTISNMPGSSQNCSFTELLSNWEPINSACECILLFSDWLSFVGHFVANVYSLPWYIVFL